MERRYLKNISSLSIEECEKLKSFKVCVVGCGGLGGYIIEMLSRIGVGSLTIIDYDTFDETNLNRQILCNENTLGKYKTDIAKQRVKLINSNVDITCINQKIDDNNCENIIRESDIVIDALDNIKARFVLEEACKRNNIPMIYGAIAGWYGQVSTILPGDYTLKFIYKDNKSGIEEKLGNPSFTPANVAAVQVAEAIKILLNKGEVLRNKLFIIDLLYNEYNIIELK